MSTAFLADTVPGVDATIAPSDGMYCRQFGDEFARAHYAESGRTALQSVRAALAAAGKGPATVRRILDLPCGYGRILRVLKAAYPRAELTACDLDRGGVDFCARQFGATPVHSDPDPTRIPLAGPFDLVWCGSLLTHLDAARWPGFLARFRSILAPDGVCVFTTQGVGAAEFIDHGRSDYGIPKPEKLVRRYRKSGFAYHPYPAGDGTYGLSLATPAWATEQVRKLPATRLVLVLEKGWHNHQDVIAFGPLPPPEWVRVGH
jgi:SAM-dependent methyltransferase